MHAKPRPADTLTHASGSPTDWAIAAALEPLDKIASETEAKWGIGVLERLVSPETAARFASARKKLDDAISAQQSDWEEVAKRASVLIRGWQALENEALSKGNSPLDASRYWAVQSETGEKFIFVQHERDMGAAVKQFPDHTVWAMSEAIRVLTDHSILAVSKVKQLFPGSTITKIDRHRSSLETEMNDFIPF